MNTALDEQKTAAQDQEADKDLQNVHVFVHQVVLFASFLLNVAILDPDGGAGRVTDGEDDRVGVSLLDSRLSVYDRLIGEGKVVVLCER